MHFVSAMSESGIEVAGIDRLTRHFSFRTTKTIYWRELPTVMIGTDVMDGICIHPALPVCGV